MSKQVTASNAFIRTALKPKMIGLLVLFLALAAICGRLGVWQLDRAYERANLSAQHLQSESENQTPQFIGEVLAPQSGFPGDLVGKEVVVTGRFIPGNDLLLPGRLVEGKEAVLVLSALEVEDDGVGGQSWADLSGAPVLPVVRGWIPPSAVSSAGKISDQWATTITPVDASVTVTGWLQASEAKGVEKLAPGLTDSVSSAHLANLWGGPIYGGYLVAQEMSPQDSAELSPLPRPTIEGGDGVNLQNFFYALQWWVFGLFAFALWARLVRDEVRRSSTELSSNPFDKVDAAHRE